jgi:hypothetical protein
VNGPGIPQALGITGVLTAAGMSSADVHAWFARPHRELDYVSPGALLKAVPTAGQAVLDVARRDATEWRSNVSTGGRSV